MEFVIGWYLGVDMSMEINCVWRFRSWQCSWQWSWQRSWQWNVVGFLSEDISRTKHVCASAMSACQLSFMSTFRMFARQNMIYVSIATIWIYIYMQIIKADAVPAMMWMPCVVTVKGYVITVQLCLSVHVTSAKHLSDIPDSSADFTITFPGYGTHTYTVSSPWGECSHAAYKGNGFIPFTTFFFRSTRYPLLLGDQRRCGFKACPRLLHMTGAAGIEPQTPRSRVLRLNHSATRSTKQSILCHDLTS